LRADDAAGVAPRLPTHPRRSARRKEHS
jgi:hypothetical protein